MKKKMKQVKIINKIKLYLFKNIIIVLNKFIYSYKQKINLYLFKTIFV